MPSPSLSSVSESSTTRFIGLSCPERLGKFGVVGDAVAVEVAVGQTVAVAVLGEDQPLAGLLEIVVATVAVHVFPIQVAVGDTRMGPVR